MKGVFFGVETFQWIPQQFYGACTSIRSAGADTVFIKVSEGTLIWYGGIPQAIQLCKDIERLASVTVIPYLYSYGQSLNGQVGEINIAKSFQQAGFKFCFDIEAEWNNHPEYATAYIDSLEPFYVTTWADPADQQSNSVLDALKWKTLAFLPQVYTAWLAGVWQAQYDNLSIKDTIPVFTPVTMDLVKNFPNFVLWEYESFSTSEIRNIMEASTPPVPGGAIKAAQDCWNSCLNYLKAIPSYNTGIAGSWKQKYYAGQYYGPPMGEEYASVDWNMNPIKVQQFTNGRCEWDKNGNPTWYPNKL